MNAGSYYGNKPFAFISYAHEDRETVYPILQWLNEQGYRLRYDTGAVPGAEWSADIAHHLNDCSAVIAFASANSIASSDFRDEISYAKSLGKPLVSVILEEVWLPVGLELLLSTYWVITRSNYHSEQVFYQTIASCPYLDPCRDDQPVESAAYPCAPAPMPAAKRARGRGSAIGTIGALLLSLFDKKDSKPGHPTAPMPSAAPPKPFTEPVFPSPAPGAPSEPFMEPVFPSPAPGVPSEPFMEPVFPSPALGAPSEPFMEPMFPSPAPGVPFETSMEPTFPSPAPAEPAAPAPVPVLDDVRFSAVSPRKVLPGDYAVIDIVMYEDAFRDSVERMLQNADGPVKETESGYFQVQKDTKVRIDLTSPELELEDCSQTVVWRGKKAVFSFDVEVPEDYRKRQILFNAKVFFENVPATRLKFTVAIDALAANAAIVPERQDFHSAFVSYASQDRSAILHIIQGMRRVRPDLDIFMDVQSLRSDRQWEPQLYAAIQSRDLFYLCWSSNAKKSVWVEREWRYALKQKGLEAIVPIPLEPPAICQPPEELNRIHFNDLDMLLAYYSG